MTPAATFGGLERHAKSSSRQHVALRSVATAETKLIFLETSCCEQNNFLTQELRSDKKKLFDALNAVRGLRDFRLSRRSLCR